MILDYTVSEQETTLQFLIMGCLTSSSNGIGNGYPKDSYVEYLIKQRMMTTKQISFVLYNNNK